MSVLTSLPLDFLILKTILLKVSSSKILITKANYNLMGRARGRKEGNKGLFITLVPEVL